MRGVGKSGSETAENRLWVTGKIRGWILGRVKNLWEDEGDWWEVCELAGGFCVSWRAGL